MAKFRTYRKQSNFYIITWDSVQKEYVVKFKGKQKGVFQNEKEAIEFTKTMPLNGVNKSKKTMATKKKPSPAQLIARENFTKMVKAKALARKKGLSAATPAKKTPVKKKRILATTLCRKVIQKEGLKVNGQLKKGYYYNTAGKIVKAKPVAPIVRPEPAVPALDDMI